MTCLSWFRVVCLTGVLVVATMPWWPAAGAQGYTPPALDTVFYLTDTAGFRVIQVTPDSVVTENVSKARITWIGGMVVSSLTPEERTRLTQFFPPTPGKRFAYEETIGNYRYQIELVVQAAETLDIGGKAMPVVRVTRHHKGVPPSTFEGEYTIWLSATHGFPLKMSYRHIAGGLPKFSDWQVVRIGAPGSLDGYWSLRITCPFQAYLSLTRVLVRDGVIVNAAPGSPSGSSITHHDLTLTRVGDEVELKGSAMAAQLNPVTVSAHGTLMPAGSVAGTAIVNSRSGCSFAGERY
jgi:hypothetical protein